MGREALSPTSQTLEEAKLALVRTGPAFRVLVPNFCPLGVSCVACRPPRARRRWSPKQLLGPGWPQSSPGADTLRLRPRPAHPVARRPPRGGAGLWAPGMVREREWRTSGGLAARSLRRGGQGRRGLIGCLHSLPRSLGAQRSCTTWVGHAFLPPSRGET